MKTFTLPSTYISNTNYEFGQVYHNLDQSKIVLDLQKDQTFVKPFETLCKDSYRSYCSYPSFMSGRPRLAKPLRRLGCRIEQGSDSGGTPLMAALPAKNWPWRPWLLWYSTNLETYRENQIDENYNKLLFGELSSGWYYYINCVSAPGSHKLPHTGRQMGVGISGLHLNDLLTGKRKTIWLKLTNFVLPNFTR